jgi:hypothetical protein
MASMLIASGSSRDIRIERKRGFLPEVDSFLDDVVTIGKTA